MCQEGENGKGPTYSTLCRCIAVDPDAGCAYLTIATGDILRYRCDGDVLEPLVGDDMRKDYFGLYDPTSPGHMGYNWRQVIWHPTERFFYGLHGKLRIPLPFRSASGQGGASGSNDPRVPDVAGCSISSTTATSVLTAGARSADVVLPDPRLRSTSMASESAARVRPPRANPREKRICTWLLSISLPPD